ncbi:MAG TPA: type I glyceraldehyde-3-phosphate dehydrogenase [Candidatus Glassbacteria bacterium]|nr:type I glyceraldehyde-3-phosphate dehydrogenase [Candidatus Glassbacteria bacterium]
MSIKIGINGFGRIGRLVFRAAMAEGGFEMVGVNDITDAKTLAHLLKYDSTHGRYPGEVKAEGDALVVNGAKVPVTSEKEPEKLPWGARGAQIVLESTGVFATAEALKKHLTAGAKKVLLTVPPKDKTGEIKLIVMGVNDGDLKKSDVLISNASCTTNCLAPMVKVLHDNFGIVHGLMTTIHAYTNDQRTLDMPHKDLRRARSACVSMIPTTTGAARAIGKVIPDLNGKLDGLSVRVPVPDGSLTDFTAVLKKSVTVEEINAAMKKAAEGELKGLLEYTEDPIVSVDIIGNPHSSIFDAACTSVIDGNLVKVLAWYDNEWGYSCRCVDLMKMMAF